MEKVIQQLRQQDGHQVGGGRLVLQPIFQTFHEFALAQLPEEKQKRFLQRSREGGWIDFYHFRSQLRHPKWGLRERLPQEVQNPEVLWFILRSYIKCFNVDAQGEARWMDPEQYESGEEIGEKDRQVSAEVFREIWEKVWPWYKGLTVPCQENRFRPPFWDDLDLAWEVLQHRWEHAPRYAVIVCDEVQDLTRLELAAVLQSLEQLKYQIPEYEVARIPIVLAGDSHQTINPACFRWGRLKADCAKALVRHMPDAPMPSIKPLQLRFNYRNRPSIARLCNGIQVFRQEILHVQGELQEIWVPEDSPYNQAVKRLIVRPGDKILRQLFREGVLFIGPEPADPQDQMGKVFWGAMGLPNGPPERLSYRTPADLKGLEEDYIALLGFGTAFPLLDIPQFHSWDGEIPLEELTERNRFALEYFLNRLYVAASRAREELWIVETEEGWRAFWEPLAKWLALEKQKRFGAESAAFDLAWVDGRAEDLVGVFNKQFEPLARQYEQRAKDTGHPEDAERAAYYYRKAGKYREETRARAIYLYLSGKKSEAAELLWTIDRSKASDWLWEAADWEQMSQKEIEPFGVGKLLAEWVRRRRRGTSVGSIR